MQCSPWNLPDHTIVNTKKLITWPMWFAAGGQAVEQSLAQFNRFKFIYAMLSLQVTA